MRLLDVVGRKQATERAPEPIEERSNFTTLDGLAQFMFNNQNMIVGPTGSSPDEIGENFTAHIHQIHKRHGVVAAAVATRALLMSQVRFRLRDELDNSLSAGPSVRQLNRPGSRTRSSMNALMEIDASYGGTAIMVRRRNKLFRLNPDETRFLLASDSDPTWDGDTLIPPFDTEVIGVLHEPGLSSRGNHRGPIESFGRGDFAVWAPEPDPIYPWRGTSWVTSVVREVLLDGQVTSHMGKFFEKAATPGLVFMMDPQRSAEQVKQYADIVDANHGGVHNAYKNMFLGGATDVKVVGAAVKDLGIDELQGTYENRVAVRSQVPAAILGIKESLGGSAMQSGNYGASRRKMSDVWFTPTAEGFCEALETISPPPAGKELSYDPDRVMFLQEDQKDSAEIKQIGAGTARTLIDGGYDADSIGAYIKTGDASKLIHTKLVSVQLQEPGVQAGGSVDGTTASDTNAREIAEMIQKIYLGVGVVITAEEARKIINREGADLSPSMEIPQ